MNLSFLFLFGCFLKMLSRNPRYELASAQAVLRPRITVSLAFDSAGDDLAWFTSHDSLGRPDGALAFDGVLKDFRGATQKVDPKSAASSIGSVSFSVVDIGGQVSALLAQKHAAGASPRRKRVTVYYGFESYSAPLLDESGEVVGTVPQVFDWLDYSQSFTVILDDYEVTAGLISFTASDIQREELRELFVPDASVLLETITAEQLYIPVSELSVSTKFQPVEHDASYSDRPGETVGYVRIDDEVIAHSGLVFSSAYGVALQVVERGALNTLAVGHSVDTSSSTAQKKKVEEFIYLEGPALKLLYAIQTGVLYGQQGTLPAHWHHGIPADLVRLSDYENADPLLWEPSSNTGRKLRFEGLKKISGESFIRAEILSALGGFRPVYSDGAIGFKRLSSVLSESDYVAQFTDDDIVRVGTLKHCLGDVINDISINWDYSFQKEVHIQTSRVIDFTSLAKYGTANPKTFDFRGVKSSNQTAQDIRNIFDAYRNRYAGGGYTFSVELLPRVHALEVGDVVRISTDQIRDPLTGLGLDRVFEVQQVTPNTLTGRPSLQLFASTEAAGEFEEITASTVLEDAFYSSEGVDIASIAVMSGNVITEDLTLVGGDTMAEGVFYYLGDLELAAGVTMYLQGNVQLRVMGHFTRNGDVLGVGGGLAGGAGGTEFLSGGQQLYVLDPDAGFHDVGEVASAFLESGGTNEGLGSSGYLGVSRAANFALLVGSTYRVNGELVWRSTIESPRSGALLVMSPALVVQGRSTVADRLALVNRDGLSVEGVGSLDLRGTGAPGGRPLVQIFGNYALDSGVDGLVEILQPGAAGGSGGAGFVLICRGESVGAGSTLDLSGEDGEVPPRFDAIRGREGTEVSQLFTNGGGGGGGPGAFYLLVDGNAVFGSGPDNIVQNRGRSGVGSDPSVLDGLGGEAYGAVFYVTNFDDAPYSLGRGLDLPVSMGEAGYKVQYIPPQEALGQGPDVQPDYQLAALQGSVELSSGDDTMLPAKDGSARERVLVRWQPSFEVQAEQYEVQAKLSSAPSSSYRTVALVGAGSSSAYFDVTAGESYVVRVRVTGGDGVIESPWLVSSPHLARGKEVRPAPPTSALLVVEAGTGLVLTVSPSASADFSKWIVLQSGVEVARSAVDRIVLGYFPHGQVDLDVFALDRSGNLSSSALTVSTLLAVPGSVSVVQSYAGEQLQLALSVSSSSYPVATYRLYDGGALLVEQAGNVVSWRVGWQGAKTLQAQAVDEGGGVSPLQSVLVSPAPPSAAQLRAQVIDNNVLLYYSAQAGSLPISRFVIAKGDTLAALEWEERKAGDSSFTTYFESAGGTARFWVYAVDSAGNAGAAASVLVEVGEPPDFVLLDSFSESASGWLGARTDCVEDAGALLLPVSDSETWAEHFADNGFADVQAAIDAGYSLFIQPGVSFAQYQRVIDLGAELASSSVSVSPNLEQLQGVVSLTVLIEYSQDGITYAAGPANTTKIYATNFRYIRYTLEASASGGAVARLRDVTTRLDVKLMTDQGVVDVDAQDAGGTFVNFNKGFIDVDSITLTPKSSVALVSAYDLDESGPSPVGFSVYLFDTSGGRVSGRVSWAARGK